MWLVCGGDYPPDSFFKKVPTLLCFVGLRGCIRLYFRQNKGLIRMSAVFNDLAPDWRRLRRSFVESFGDKHAKRKEPLSRPGILVFILYFHSSELRNIQMHGLGNLVVDMFGLPALNPGLKS